MIRDYENDIIYSENGIVKIKGDERYNRPNFQEVIDKAHQTTIEYLNFAVLVKKYMKVKGDMLVMENVSRKKHAKDFEEMEKFIYEHQR